jgi:nucleotide-binding universal stress UspA family protein
MKALVAADGSEEADNALDYAVEIVDGVGGSITVVHAVDPAVYDEGGSEPISTLSDAKQRLILENIEDAEQRGLDVLEDAVELAADLGHDAEGELLYGDPARAIPEYAEAEGFDAIYVGHRGRSERTAALMGSVAKAIVEQVTIPVTVVR